MTSVAAHAQVARQPEQQLSQQEHLKLLPLAQAVSLVPTFRVELASRTHRVRKIAMRDDAATLAGIIHKRHPDRSEGSPLLPNQPRFFAALRMTFLANFAVLLPHRVANPPQS